jgi:anti-anti-sigma factor
MTFSYKTYEENNVYVLIPVGKILSEEETFQLDQLILNALESGSRNIIINFENVSHINSTGISFVIRSLTRSRIHGGDLSICCIDGNVKNIFEIAKISDIISIFETPEEAILHFN